VSSATRETRISLSAPQCVAARSRCDRDAGTAPSRNRDTEELGNLVCRKESIERAARAGAVVRALDVRAIRHRTSGRAVNQRRVEDRAAESRGHRLSRVARDQLADGVDEFRVDAAVEGHEPFTYW
jgi:hypothetical protein